MKKIFIVLVVLLVGCSSTLKYDIPTGKRIGVINRIENHYTHTYIGITKWNNFEKDVPFASLEIPKYVNDNVSKELEFLGYTPVIINDIGDLYDGKETLLSIGWSDLYVKEDCKSDLAEIIKQNQVDMLLIFETYRGQDHIGRTPNTIDGYGLYTAASLFYDYSAAYATIHGYGVYSSPIAYIGMGSSGETMEVDLSELNESNVTEIEVEVQKIVDDVISNTLMEVNLIQ